MEVTSSPIRRRRLCLSQVNSHDGRTPRRCSDPDVRDRCCRRGSTAFGAVEFRIRYVSYEADQVVRIDASYGASTMIVFARDEKIETIAAGDPLAWKVSPTSRVISCF